MNSHSQAKRFSSSSPDLTDIQDLWAADFVGVGTMQGVGWAICYYTSANGDSSNPWVSTTEVGNVIGFRPILVTDCWRQAYLLNDKPAKRAKYIEAFFWNINWESLDSRLNHI
jgi:Fe-Mn family superoxide dismutase